MSTLPGLALLGGIKPGPRASHTSPFFVGANVFRDEEAGLWGVEMNRALTRRFFMSGDGVNFNQLHLDRTERLTGIPGLLKSGNLHFSAPGIGPLVLELRGFRPVMVRAGETVIARNFQRLAAAEGSDLLIRGAFYLLPDPEGFDLPWLTTRFEEAGLLQEGIVRPLESASEGIRFFETLVTNLPQEVDPIEILEHLNYGPWDESKGINATLRSLAMFRERWEGNKLLALEHPFHGRGGNLLGFIRIVRRSADAEPSVKKGLFIRLYPIVSRLLVEIAVADYYLSDEGRFRRLADLPSESAVADLKRALREEVDKVRANIDYLAGVLNVSRSDLKSMNATRYEALFS